jgi:hypothetical protein
LERYQEASRLDSENADYKRRIVEVGEKIEEEREKERTRREQERARNQQVRDLLSEARELRNDEDLLNALEIYEKALSLDGDSEHAMEGIRETKVKIDEFKERKAYVEKVDLYDFEASTIDTYIKKGIPAVKFKIKNTGDKALSEVEVTVYLKDSAGNVISEEDFHPVLTSGFSFSGNNKPLKPGYIWEL